MKIVILTVLLFFGLSSIFSLCQAGNTDKHKTPVMTLKAELDIKRGILFASADVSGLSSLRDLVVSDFSILEVKTDGTKIPFSVEGERIVLKKPVPWDESRHLTIFFEKPLGKDGKISGSREFMGGNLSEGNFILLMSNWCPAFTMPALYELSVAVPKGFTAVSEADRVIQTRDGWKETFKFEFGHPRESISLIAGKFQVTEKLVNGITVSTFFLDKDEELAKRFLEKTASLIQLFSSRISPYPFKRFCIVENPATSGLSLPTITLIGKQILRMPFVLDTSLGHEILHSWFGNSVYVDYSRGNWCEGLTAYLADHSFKEQEGKGAEYRHQILCDYKSYVNGKNVFPLKAFRTRTDRPSKAIGYGKAAMTFHMLRQLVGDEVFFRAVSDFSVKFRFQKASWQDLEHLFSSHSGRNLKYFFRQWLERKDIPELQVTDAEAEQKGQGGFVLKLRIWQKNKDPYELRVPLTIFTPEGQVRKVLSIRGKQEDLTIPVEKRPVSAVLDEGYDVMRDLDINEFPPSIARLFGAEKRFVIMPAEKDKGIYFALISFLKSRGFETIPRDQLRHSMFKTGSFVVLGETSGKLSSLGPAVPEPAGGMVVALRNNPFNSSQVTCTIKASSAAECTSAMFKLPHYGKYAFLEFSQGKIQKKRQADYQKGISVDIKGPMCGISSKAIQNASSIIQSLTQAKVIYLGERHDSPGIHEAQYRILKELGRTSSLAVAMEMFQKPFQKVLDDYLAGKISEREFLEKTEYFKRWGFNYHFYRPIVEFCKKQRIPIIAMNLPKEISQKIARSGMEGLDEEEKKYLPQKLDLGSRLYRQMLRRVYQGHQSDNLQNFDSFFQAQIAWDETMAKSIADFLIKHPEKKMIVIVGGGHVAYGYGIPSRVKRRLTDIRQDIVLFPETGQIDPLEADHFLFVPSREEPFTAKLGVMLSGEHKLTVENVVPGSPAAAGGIQKGDVLKAVDGHKIKDIYDLKLQLFFMRRGQKARITILRTDQNGRTMEKEILTGPLAPFKWKSGGFHFHRNK